MWIGSTTNKEFFEAIDRTVLDFVTNKLVDGTPAKDNGTSTFSVTVGGMATDYHAGATCKFLTSGNPYPVVSNTADTVTVEGDASGETADQTVALWPFVADEHKGKLCTFHGGEPERDFLICGNSQNELTLRHNAEGESGDLVHVEDLDTVIRDRQLDLHEVALLRRWAARDFTGLDR